MVLIIRLSTFFLFFNLNNIYTKILNMKNDIDHAKLYSLVRYALTVAQTPNNIQ